MEPYMKVYMNLNLGFIRYTLVSINYQIYDVVYLQMPWWSLKDAMFRSRFWFKSRSRS